ncbi:hypothetical protein FPT15_12950 [Pseudomonas sp. RGB]|nr:hypothetical protein FPT15_12950 [Pseudomonas sp. RGB]
MSSGSRIRSAVRPPCFAFDFDLRHTEPKRGAEWWGKSLLVAFGLFSKVTRRKGGTPKRPSPKQRIYPPKQPPIRTYSQPKQPPHAHRPAPPSRCYGCA